jgi:hypothetical protein
MLLFLLLLIFVFIIVREIASSLRITAQQAVILLQRFLVYHGSVFATLVFWYLSENFTLCGPLSYEFKSIQ